VPTVTSALASAIGSAFPGRALAALKKDGECRDAQAPLFTVEQPQVDNASPSVPCVNKANLDPYVTSGWDEDWLAQRNFRVLLHAIVQRQIDRGDRPQEARLRDPMRLVMPQPDVNVRGVDTRLACTRIEEVKKEDWIGDLAARTFETRVAIGDIRDRTPARLITLQTQSGRASSNLASSAVQPCAPGELCSAAVRDDASIISATTSLARSLSAWSRSSLSLESEAIAFPSLGRAKDTALNLQ
jgi:hypothetical protein